MRNWQTAAQHRRILALMFLLVSSLLTTGCDPVDRAIAELQQANLSFERITLILQGVKENLDEGRYRDQVEEIVGRVGEVAIISGASMVILAF